MSYIYPEFFDKAWRDRIMSFAVAFSFHLFLLWGGARVLIEPVSYGVEAGMGSLEVSLVAAPPENVVAVEKGRAELESPAAAVSAPTAVVSAPAAGDGSSSIPGQDVTTLSARGGASGQTGPGYLKNPAPRYPEASRRAGEEGLALLFVRVSKDGAAAEVGIKAGSGFPALDEAAQRAVRRWRFKPALFGGFPVESEVEVPIRFQLEDKRQS